MDSVQAKETYLVLIPLPDASRLYGSKITQKKGKDKEKKREACSVSRWHAKGCIL